jgi:hypothetical protein
VAVGLVLMATVAMVAPDRHGLRVEHLQAMLEGDDDTVREVDDAFNYKLEQQMAQSTGENTDSYSPFEMDPAQVYVAPCLYSHMLAYDQCSLRVVWKLCCSAADPLKYKTAVKTQQHQRDDQYFGWMNQIHGLSKQLAGCQGEFFVIQEHKEKGQIIKAAGISKHIIDFTLDRIKEARVSCWKIAFEHGASCSTRSVSVAPSCLPLPPRPRAMGLGASTHQNASCFRQVEHTPYQHLYVTNVFEPSFYRCMMANLPYEYKPEEYFFEKKETRQTLPLGFSRVGDVRKQALAYGNVLETEWCVAPFPILTLAPRLSHFLYLSRPKGALRPCLLDAGGLAGGWGCIRLPKISPPWSRHPGDFTWGCIHLHLSSLRAPFALVAQCESLMRIGESLSSVQELGR